MTPTIILALMVLASTAFAMRAHWSTAVKPGRQAGVSRLRDK